MADVFPKVTVQAWMAKLRKHFKALKQAFSFGNESKTTALTKSKLSGDVLSCLAICTDILWRSLCKKESRKKAKLITVVFVDFPWAVSFLIELDMSLRSVSLI